MKAKRKVLTIIISLLIAITLLYGCIEEKQPDKNNKEIEDENKEEVEKITIQIHQNFSKTSYQNESIWDEYNASSSLTREFYVTNTSIQEIVDWYTETGDIKDWAIKSNGIQADPEDFRIIFGYVKLQKNEEVKNQTIGVYILTKEITDDMNLEYDVLVGFAEGQWDLIDSCGKQA